MNTAAIRDITIKASVLFALGLALVFGCIAVSQAQTAVSSPPPEKVEQLLKLLDDPDVKAWITTKGTPHRQRRLRPRLQRSDFMLWSNAIRAHLRGIGQAIPAVPGEFSGASSTIMTEINGRGPGAILLLFAAFAALGFGAEFLFRRFVSQANRRNVLPDRSGAARTAPHDRPLDLRRHRTPWWSLLSPASVRSTLSPGPHC